MAILTIALTLVNEAPAVANPQLVHKTGLQVLYITSLVAYYKQITNSLHEQGTQKSQLASKCM